jgi:sec-independent protein translocase protein TatA
MFQNIGFSEILLIGIVALLLFGPQKLPEIGRTIGKTLNDLKRGARELMEDVKTEAPKRIPEHERTAGQVQTNVSDNVQTVTPEAASPEAEDPAPARPGQAARRLPD